MNIKENLINTLTNKENEMTPVTAFPAVCMLELMDKEGLSFPIGHTDPEQMAKIAASSYEYAGLEGMTLPFDLGFEAEAMGCTVDINHNDNSSSITHAPFEEISDVEMPDDYTSNGRFPTLIKATEILHEEYDDKNVPIIGALSGPMTVLGQCLGIEGILKKLSSEYYDIEDAIDSITEGLIQQVELYNELDMNAIVLYEPNGTPELVDPHTFDQLLKPFHEDITDATDIPIVLHICGDTSKQLENMMTCGYQGISIANDVNITHAKEVRSEIGAEEVNICGNISTDDTLFMKPVETVVEQTQECLEKGVDILCPSCMIAPASPLINVKAFVETRNKFFE
ncbi:MAG: uroporphyrinogen decarboxylase family protein [Methanobacteriaceae archaeon]|nr:uroporphyrinogen decarboxylase family protein [Methanobacteriaceae archaeon]